MNVNELSSPSLLAGEEVMNPASHPKPFPTESQ